MLLYYSPGACSQAPHILLHELGLDHDARRVDLRAKTTEDGGSFLDINPKGSVPTLRTDDGELLTENAVILQYLGDQGGGEMLPRVGNFHRYRVLEWVNFITTELHKSFSPLFKPNASDETKQFFRDQIAQRFDYVEKRLGDGSFLMGKAISIADPYLFVISRWGDSMIGLDKWPNIAAFRERMMQRHSVRHVLRFEGLLEKEVAQ